MATPNLVSILSQLTAKLTASNNLSDLTNAATARTNLALHPRFGSAASRMVVDFGSRFPNQTQLSDGVATIGTSRMRHKAIGNISDLSVLYVNASRSWYANTTGFNDTTITASIEYPSGTFTQLTFSGATSYVLKVGARVVTDVPAIEIPDGGFYWVRTSYTVTSGQKWLNAWATETSINEGATTGSDLTMSGSITNSTGYCFGPTAVYGVSSSTKPSFFLLGDSIATGTNDSGFTTIGYQIGGGIFGRSLGSNYPCVQANIASDKISNWATVTANRANFPQTFGLANYFMCQLGVNDLVSTDTVATIQANLIFMWDYFRGRGVYGFQTTITPKTASTDSWATTGNQTTNATVEAKRPTLNTWIRDGAPINMTTRAAVAAGDASGTTIRAGHYLHPLIGYIEVANTVETSQNSGIWKAPGYTTDGLHGTSTSYPLMAAPVTTAISAL